ncbi:hypothetical protein DFP73DRAFT_552430 [Morchella snyderi]|nr:hypothetical protein DFP73DRAFT_552430 [Morchella snyderi]
MPPILPTGPYVIYHPHSKIVLHAEKDEGNLKASITRKARDEDRYFEEQIWWIERCPESDDFDTDPKYLITNTASNRCLSRDSSHPLLSQIFGAQREQWSLLIKKKDGANMEAISAQLYQAVDDGSDVSTLSIGTFHNMHDICLFENYSSSGSEDCLNWEFIAPNTKFPAGWFEIGNALEDRILSQTYITSPPLLIGIPKLDSKLRPPMYRERWATQWKLYRFSAHSSAETKEDDKDISWIIENRLTGARLGCYGYFNKSPSEDAFITAWILEFHGGESFWRIKNKRTLSYLEQKICMSSDRRITYPVVADNSFCRRFPDDMALKWWFRNVYDH